MIKLAFTALALALPAAALAQDAAPSDHSQDAAWHNEQSLTPTQLTLYITLYKGQAHTLRLPIRLIPSPPTPAAPTLAQLTSDRNATFDLLARFLLGQAQLVRLL